MNAATEKQIKEQLNEAKQSTEEKGNMREGFSNEVVQDIETESDSQKSLKHIQEIFQKTENMKLATKERNAELENQFKDLKQKLNSSSEYLQRMKKNIENIKFSFEKNVTELQKNIDPTTASANSKFESKQETAHYMEDIHQRIEDLQNRMTAQREKQQNVTQSYEEAFDQVINALQQIDSGTYATKNIFNDSFNHGE